MGFTTGFLGGLTLTYSAVYLTVYVHQQNRTYQSTLLRQQARLLNTKLQGAEPEYALPAYRLEDAGLEEQFKDKWNRLIETGVSKAEHVDWEAVRIDLEHKISNAWKSLKSMNTNTPGKVLQADGDPLAGKRLLEEK